MSTLFLGCVLACAAPAFPDGLAAVESNYYVIETNVPLERAKWIGRLMDATGKEFSRRFEGFRGVVRQKPRVKVFSTRDEYLSALRRVAADPNLQHTRGVFVPGDKTVYTFDDKDGQLERILKHECFHQFVHLVVGGQLAAWVDEGLAEYFAEGVFDEATGRLRLGAVPAARVAVLKKAREANSLPTVAELLKLESDTWNDRLADRGAVQYSTAWALCHFLIHADGGRYAQAFETFLRQIDGGLDSDTAFKRAFGGEPAGLQEKFHAYLAALRPAEPPPPR